MSVNSDLGRSSATNTTAAGGGGQESGAMSGVMQGAMSGVAPAPLPSVPVIFWIGWFSFREMVRRRRLISLALLSLLPVLLLLAIRLWYDGEAITPYLIFATLSYDTYIPFLVPVVAMAVGASAIGEPVEDGTIIYYWSRPVRRGAIYLGRLLAAQMVAATVLVASLALCFVILTFGESGVVNWTFIRLYLTACAVIVIGVCVYTAVFACVGTVVRKPLLPAILFAFGWEPMVSSVPQRIQEYTLRFHLRNLIESPEQPAQTVSGFLGNLIRIAFDRPPVPAWQSVLVLVGVLLVTTLLGMWLLGRKEIVQ